VGPQQRGDRALESGGDLQQLRLRRGIQAVAALDLDRGDSEGEEAAHPLAGQLGQLGGRRLAGGLDRGHDAARPMGLASEPGGELARAVAREDQVGVAVDQPGQDGPAAGVDLLGARRDPGVGVATQPGDPPAFGDQGTRFDHPQGGIAGDQARVPDDKGHGRKLRHEIRRIGGSAARSR